MIAFKKDQTLYRGDVHMRVVRQLGLDDIQLENVVTGELSNHKTFNLLQEYADGELLTSAQRRHRLATGIHTPSKPARMDHMSKAAKQETRRRIDYLVRLEKKGAFLGSRTDLRKALSDIAIERGEQRPPHESTVYRWRRKFLVEQRDIRAVFCEFDKQGGKGLSRLDAEVEGIVHQKIDAALLAGRRWSAEDVHNAVFLEIQQRNATRIEPEWLVVPGLRTIQRRLSDLYAFDLAVARFGEKEAERRFANHLGARRVSRILEIVEIDHSPVDIMVTDKNRIVIGRPTITVVLDRKSRCVLGYHLSLAGHGVPAVFAALKHAFLPKTYLASPRYADLQLEWACFGWAETILMDNGREFHATAIADALANIGVIAEFAKSRDPNDKPHVERFLKTFNYSFIHKLPGTTLAKVHDRIGFKAEDDATLTLEELDRKIHVWICSQYHLRRHAGLEKRTPMAVWAEGAAACPPQLKANKEDLDIEFAEVTTSALQHYGIDLNTWVYVSARLLTLRRMLPENSSVNVKWPRDDVGHVWIWDQYEEEYFKVPNKNDEYAGLSLEQAKAARKAKAAGDRDYKQTRSKAADIVRDMVGAAMADKKLKARRKGARLANTKSSDFRADQCTPQAEPLPEAASPTTPAAPLEDFDVEVPAFEGEA